MLEKLENYFIADFNRRDAYVYSRYRMVLRATVLTSIFSFFYLVLSFVVQYQYGTYLMIFNVSGFLLLPFLMKTRIPIKLIGNLYVFIGALAVIVVINFSGGVESPVLPWLIAPPVLALLVVDRLYAWVWTAISLSALMYFSNLAINGEDLPILYNEEWKYTFVMLSSAGIIMIVMVVGLIFASNTSSALDEVAAQKEELNAQHELIKDNNAILTAQQEELVTTSEKLKELNNKKDFLLEILAHDLKSPLANIQGLLGIIKTDGFKPNTLEARVFRLIVESTKKSQRLIDKILSAENLEDVVYDLKLERVNVHDVLYELTEGSREDAARKDIAIHYLNGHGKDYTALVDKVYLSQIYSNLLNNAIKFSPRGKSIRVVLEAKDESIITKIVDEGPGIPQEEMEELFKKYGRISNKPTGTESSSGLGLSIVKHYADLLNGKVWCESQVGEGCKFIVELPRA